MANHEMDSLLGFKEAASDDVVEDKSHSFKVVPWISWDEWKFVRQSLFSSTPNCVAAAFRRIATWRSRGCIPVAVEITASIVEIQQKDPFFRNNLNESLSPSGEMLAMLYCMAIMRLVNGVIEKTRKKNEVSIGEAADAIGIPRMLIDIRHEGSHRDLPSLKLLRLASEKALDWLVSYYWEPQERAIPIQTDQAANLRKEIKQRLHEVALCLKAKQMAKSNSSPVKGKRSRKTETLHGRNKFLSLVAGKSSHSNTVGLKKQLKKSLKNIFRLYYTSCLDVVYALLEYLLNALDSSKSSEQLQDSQGVHSTENKQTAFDHWKSVVLKLSSKEPEFLLVLTQAVLGKMETREATSIGSDGLQCTDGSVKYHRAELLSHIFEWLTKILKAQPKESVETKGSTTGKHLTEATVLGLLRRCLLLSFPGNEHLLSSAIILAEMIGDSSLLHKLKKLALLNSSNSDGGSFESLDENLLSRHECSLQDAERKFELFKLRHLQAKQGKPRQSETGRNSRWAVAKSWNPCPIGMLPDTIGFLGRPPALDCTRECGETSTVLSTKEDSQHGKREADSGIEEMDHMPVKKMKETEADCTMLNQKTGMDAEGVRGCMMIDGTWRKVGQDELLALTSAVRLLV